jgi:hypothetical protein
MPLDPVASHMPTSSRVKRVKIPKKSSVKEKKERDT